MQVTDEWNVRRTAKPMQLGMIGLGRMGANLVRRLTAAGHDCVAYDRDPKARETLATEGVRAVDSVQAMTAELTKPRAIWMMVPAAVVGDVVEELVASLDPGDILVDGGNSHYRDDIQRSRALAEKGISLVDCGTSGGVWGLERGYSLMIGGDDAAVARLDPIFASLAPGRETATPTPSRTGRNGTAPDGYYHCGPSGAGHFVKMVHNGVEYGMMAAISEGLAIIRNADVGLRIRQQDAETTPLREPEAYRYRIDVGEVAEVWRRGTVISSWLVDLAADALAEDDELKDYAGRVSDSGEGRWTAIAAIEEGVPAPVITTALQERFASRGRADFADRALSAMRFEFGGHHERG